MREDHHDAAPAPAAASPTGAADLLRVLGITDIVLMTTVAVVGTRWITRGARAGAPSVTLWLLAWLLFLVPLALVVSELSSRYPEQGGLYKWVHRAFGPVHGFICGWCLFVNNLFYFPSLLLFAAANVAAMLGPEGASLANSHLYSVTLVLALIWLTVTLTIRGFGAGRWLQNLGAIATWVPAALLVAAALICLWLFGSATSFAPRDLWPREDALSTISLWSAMCFAFSGFEISAFSSAEVKQPERTIPRAIWLSGIVVTLIYIAGSTSVLIALPAGALSERSGIADAIDLVASRLGLAGLGLLTAGLVALGSIAGNASWFAGSARLAYAAGLDRTLPPAMARLHPRFKTPHVALIAQGVVASLIILGSLFLTLTGAQGSVQNAYDEMVNLTILIYFLPYLYLFVAVVKLRGERAPGDEEAAGVAAETQSDGEAASAQRAHGGTQRPSREGSAQGVSRVRWIPGGRAGLWLAAGAGFLATAISMGLLFVPPPGTTNVLNFELKILLNTAIVIGAGAAQYAFLRRRAAGDR